ncbi:MAG: universal stress protein [Acidimicrobiales bacterium]
MIAVDNTEESVHAADVAGRLFGSDAEYLAVSVVEADVGAAEPQWWGGAWATRYPAPYGAVWPLPGVVRSRTPGAEVDDSPAQMAIRAAEDTARRAVEESELATADIVGEIGDPADVITSAAQDRSADVIVLGTHDRSWFDRLLRRSVGKHVLEESRVPVLVVPPRGE